MGRRVLACHMPPRRRTPVDEGRAALAACREAGWAADRRTRAQPCATRSTSSPRRTRAHGRGAGAAVRCGPVHRGPGPHPRHPAQRHRDRRRDVAAPRRRRPGWEPPSRGRWCGRAASAPTSTDFCRFARLAWSGEPSRPAPRRPASRTSSASSSPVPFSASSSGRPSRSWVTTSRATRDDGALFLGALGAVLGAGVAGLLGILLDRSGRDRS